jgi:GNAT superfamily N-acetyltransferase
MQEADIIARITQDMERYLGLLAQSANMQHHTGEIEWIAPRPGKAGPALVSKLELDGQSAASRVEEAIPDILSGVIPALWLVSPAATPSNIMDILVSKGFRDLYNPEDVEPGMALKISEAVLDTDTPVGLELITVQSKEEFSQWVQTVNIALHGWDMIDAESYYFLVAEKKMLCYTALLEGKAVATAATIQAGSASSLEFVSTLADHRKKGIGTAICAHAIGQLIANGADLVTLRANPDAVQLYTRMGFRPYFNIRAATYDIKNPTEPTGSGTASAQ